MDQKYRKTLGSCRIYQALKTTLSSMESGSEFEGVNAVAKTDKEGSLMSMPHLIDDGFSKQ